MSEKPVMVIGVRGLPLICEGDDLPSLICERVALEEGKGRGVGFDETGGADGADGGAESTDDEKQDENAAAAQRFDAPQDADDHEDGRRVAGCPKATDSRQEYRTVPYRRHVLSRPSQIESLYDNIPLNCGGDKVTDAFAGRDPAAYFSSADVERGGFEQI